MPLGPLIEETEYQKRKTKRVKGRKQDMHRRENKTTLGGKTRVSGIEFSRAAGGRRGSSNCINDKKKRNITE